MHPGTGGGACPYAPIFKKDLYKGNYYPLAQFVARGI